MAKAVKPVTAPRTFREIPSPDQNLKIAATYIRVSTDEQTEYSPASQLKKVREWGEAHGYIIPDEYVFVDEGISGKKVTGRDAFRQMIGVAKSKPKPFEAILLWKFSRFARNRDDAVFYKSILNAVGTGEVSIPQAVQHFFRRGLGTGKRCDLGLVGIFGMDDFCGQRGRGCNVMMEAVKDG